MINLSHLRDIAETVLLILIWRDGREILKVEKASHELYLRYFADRQSERTTRLKSLSKAREAKATKREETQTINNFVEVCSDLGNGPSPRRAKAEHAGSGEASTTPTGDSDGPATK